MFVDSRELSPRQVVECDLCIVGAGAAGIAMAREFIGTNKDVVLLESGGFEYDERTQSLYTGKNTGLPTFPVHLNRLRYFGGTTNHWAGHCRPLDAIDFEKKDWMPHSGWPITREDLEPYYPRAQPIMELGEYRYEDLGFFTGKTGLPDLPLDRERIKSAVYNQSPPTRFGTVYRDQLGRAPNIRVHLHANALRFNTDASAATVQDIDVACIDGPRFSVRPRTVVLAAGGMENARLLLLSDQVARHGLGNDNGLVGRYFMDHVLLRPGLDVSFTRLGTDLRLYHSVHDVAGGKMFAVLAATEQMLRREKMANFRIHLVLSGPRYRDPVGGIFSELDGYEGENPLVKGRDNSIAMHMVLEPFPNPESRVSLSATERDLFDQRKLEVKWLLTPAELSNAHRALELVALEFGRMGLGRGYGEIFRDDSKWPGNLEAGKHHCGTTRMSDSAKTGVVDANCRVFGVDNLYLAGSSLFPTIGYANPTPTILALALRLTDHIKGLS